MQQRHFLILKYKMIDLDFYKIEKKDKKFLNLLRNKGLVSLLQLKKMIKKEGSKFYKKRMFESIKKEHIFYRI